jgi:hypothetical protein
MGDACSAAVSATFCFFFTPETTRFTVRRMNSCSARRIRAAISRISTIRSGVPHPPSRKAMTVAQN